MKIMCLCTFLKRKNLKYFMKNVDLDGKFVLYPKIKSNFNKSALLTVFVR